MNSIKSKKISSGALISEQSAISILRLIGFGKNLEIQNRGKNMIIENKMRFMLVGFLLLELAFNSFAHDGKMIAEMARKARYESPVSASGVGISGTFTPTKVSSGQQTDLSTGALIGLLKLEVSSRDYGKLRTGKFDLFLKNEKSGLRLYLEEKEIIAAVLEVTETTPEGYFDTKSSDKSSIAFPLPEENVSRLFNLQSFQANTNFGFSAKRPGDSQCRRKIYVKIYIRGHGYWVWSGSSRPCRGNEK